VDHGDHVALIRGGVEGAGPRWLELGAGEGAFTLALADVLGPVGEIIALDRDRGALRIAAAAVQRRFPAIAVSTLAADFTASLPEGPFDGILAANSLHFVGDRRAILATARAALLPGADRGNPWVPHPFSFDRWLEEAAAAGFDDVRILHRVPSRFLGAIYGAVATRSAAGTP